MFLYFLALPHPPHGVHIIIKRAFDNTTIQLPPFQDPEVVSVSLQSQDFIGLGFNIWGSMRDGVFVSQVHNRGPAIETGKIKPGINISHLSSGGNPSIKTFK